MVTDCKYMVIVGYKMKARGKSPPWLFDVIEEHL